DVAEHEVAGKASEKAPERNGGTVTAPDERPRKRRSLEKAEPPTPQTPAGQNITPATRRARGRDALPEAPGLPAEGEQPKATRTEEKKSGSGTESVLPAAADPHADFGGAP